jgi:hypothetical protein
LAAGGGTPTAPRGGGGPGALTSSRTVTADTPGSERSFSCRLAADLLGGLAGNPS